MKASQFPVFLLLAVSALPLHAATYSSDFTSLAPGDPLQGVGGWQQSAPNYDTIYPRAFGTQIQIGSSTAPAAAVGGYYDTEPPEGQTYFCAFHSLDLGLQTGASFSTNFALVDSEGYDVDGTLYGAERNPFQITLRNAANAELFSVIFDPVAGESPDPTASANDAWNVSWSSGGIKSIPIAAVFESALYGLNIQFIPVGSDLNFSLGMNGTNSFSYSGTLTGLASSSVSQVEFGIHAVDSDSVGTPQFGTNHIVFQGITMVPEPSTAFLAGGAALLLALRRRRSL